MEINSLYKPIKYKQKITMFLSQQMRELIFKPLGANINCSLMTSPYLVLTYKEEDSRMTIKEGQVALLL